MPNHFGVKTGGVEGLFEPHRIVYPLIDLTSEGDLHRFIESIDIHFIDFAIGPNDDGLVIGCPGVAGVAPENGPGFLLVFGELVVHRPFPCRFQVANVQHRLGTHPPHKSQEFSVPGYLRAHCTSSPARDGFNFSSFPIELFDHKNLVVGIFVVLKKAPRRHVFAVVHVTAIGRHVGFVEVLLVVFAGRELDAFAATKVVHPKFTCTERALGREVFAGDDVFAIGCPDAVVDQTEILFGDLSGVFAVTAHHPGVVATTGIGSKEDFLAIGAVFGLHLKGMAAAQQTRFTTLSRYCINISQ